MEDRPQFRVELRAGQRRHRRGDPRGRDRHLLGAASSRRCSSSGIEGGAASVVVDLGKVTFIDSTALGVLVSGAKRVRPHNGTLDIVCIDENIIRIFEITGLDRIFGIYPEPRRGPQGGRPPERRPSTGRTGGGRRRVTAQRAYGARTMEFRSTRTLRGTQPPQRGRRHVEDEDIWDRAHLHRRRLRDAPFGVQPLQRVRPARGRLAGRLPPQRPQGDASARRSPAAAPSSRAAASSSPPTRRRSTAATPAA